MTNIMGKSPDWMPDILTYRGDGYETKFYKEE